MFIFCPACWDKMETEGYQLGNKIPVPADAACEDCGKTLQECPDLIVVSTIAAPPEKTCGFVKAAVKNTLARASNQGGEINA